MSARKPSSLSRFNPVQSGARGMRDRQRCFDAARGRYGEQLRVAVVEHRTRRREEDGGPVGREALGDVGAGVPGQPLRHAARGGHHEDVHVAVVLGAEGNRRAVWREHRTALDARVARQASDVTPLEIADVEVARIDERDVRCAHRGLLQQTGVGHVECTGRRQQQQRKGRGSEEMTQVQSDHAGIVLPSVPPGSLPSRAAPPRARRPRSRHGLSPVRTRRRAATRQGDRPRSSRSPGTPARCGRRRPRRPCEGRARSRRPRPRRSAGRSRRRPGWRRDRP